MKSMIDAEELLRKYPEFCIRVVDIHALLSGEEGKDELIERLALGRKPLDGMPIAKGWAGSKTETIAILLDSLHDKGVEGTKEERREWAIEMEMLIDYIALYNMVTARLTEQEYMLVEQHFQNGYSLRKLARGEVSPELNIPSASLYELRRTKTKLLRKVEKMLKQRQDTT